MGWLCTILNRTLFCTNLDYHLLLFSTEHRGCDYKTGRVVTMEELERKGKPTHIAMRAGSVFDDSAWKLLKWRVPKYRIYDDELAWGDYS